MAQYRQYGAERFAFRTPHDFHHSNDSNNGALSDQTSIRIPHKQARYRRPNKNQRRISFAAVAVILSLGLFVTFFAFHHLSRDTKDIRGRFDDQDGDSKHGIHVHFQPGLKQSAASKELSFGHGSTKVGRDSRYWDRDDRRRDEDYNEDVLEHSSTTTDADHISENERSKNKQRASENGLQESEKKEELKHGSGGLYNEAGRDELKKYEDKYEASLKNVDQPGERRNQGDEVNSSDEYDDGIDIEDAHADWSDELDHADGDHLDETVGMNNGGGISSDTHDGGISNSGSQRDSEKHSSVVSMKSAGDTKKGHRHTGSAGGELSRATSSGKKSGSKRKPKNHKFSGSSCVMKFLNSTNELVEPVENTKFSRFSLQYTEVEDIPSGLENWEPRFAGYQSLQEREESFYARDQKINCGFIKGPNGSPGTGFDLAEDDVRYMSTCHIAVSSCIFGNSDHLRTPYSKTITRSSRKNVCFVMFVDEITLQTLSSEGQKPDRMGFIGLWRIVVVKNLPYTDMRRVGKIPKFLAHRLFPSARYSIWLDSKLRLQSDPSLILEYFLWRKGYEYAISNHYDRHCVWEEVIQNKKLNKFNHTIIDQQFAFYQDDGLKRFDPSDPNRLLPSHVPEGSFIIRAHTPMSNLFSCLWFNEVDRFTPRDQLSFAYTYLKLRRMNPGKHFYLNMFKDCERRSIAKLFRHRAEDKLNSPAQAIV